MRYSRLALVVGLYLCLDLTNPFIGRAFIFDVGESVDGIAGPHERLSVQMEGTEYPVPGAGATAGSARTAPGRRLQVRLLDGRFVQLGRARAPLPDPQSASEDH